MDLRSCLRRVSFLMCLLVFIGRARAERRVFNVMQYGAVADGRTDNAKAFLNAWNEACQWKGRTRVFIPNGTYILGPLTFKGPCNAPITFVIKGVIKADPDLIHIDQWINFRYIDKLIVNGGGSIDGQGALGWSRNLCNRSSNCNRLPASMGFDFVTNSRIHHIRSFDSKSTHFNIFGCNNLNITKIRISAPDESPNTDGIRIGSSTHINISRSVIGTGDDCISMLSGSENISIWEIVCGPGHGISVGSLGLYMNETNVTELSVRNCTFVSTENGVRIKTWASSPSSSFASHLRFEDLEMRNVSNPIIIDQEYCPHPPCDQDTPSQVQISDVLFANIWGVSGTKNAVFLRCSREVPCRNINMQDINLSYNGTGGPAKSVCYHVSGVSSGSQNPPPCI